MGNFRSWWLCLTAVVLVLLGGAGALEAQAPTGNLFGTVTDTEGNPLPGVRVTLSGVGADRVQFTNAQGQFRFPNLDPERYNLLAELQGFSTVEYPNIEVRAARSVTIQVTMSSAIEETITVTSESPLLDERKIKEGTTITQVELEKIPTARDPWSVLTQTPGVLVDRINVGGNQSGQQSVFVGPGVTDDENDFLVDGVQITDMAAIGASPTYYDFDQFTQMEFSTGGTDVTKNTAGVSVNLITKRGTNEFRGSARFLLTDEDFGGILQQADPDISRSDFGEGQPITEQFGNSVSRIEDFGIEGGGPIVRDKLWLWSSWGEADIAQLTADGQNDDTILENFAAKLNVQFTGSNSAQGSFNNGNKQKFGRSAGPTRPRPTAWNQRGPSAVSKFEDTHIFNPNFFLTGAYSKVDGGFGLNCIACINAGSLPATAETFLDSNGIWQNSFISGNSKRPAEEWKVDGSYFFNTGNTNHELKFGGRMREFEQISFFAWPGRDLFHIDGVLFGIPDPIDLFIARRGIDGPPNETEYTSFWAQDTITFKRFTVNAGLRYDLQEGQNKAAVVPANPGVPDIMPAFNFPGVDAGFEWEDITPRVGITYALGEERKTLLRASFSQFPEQLQTGDVNRINPAGSAYVTFLSFDENGNNLWDGPQEGFLVIDTDGIDLNDPTSILSPNVNDPGLDAPITSEFIVGAEHAFLPEFIGGLSVTYRLTDDLLESRDFIRDLATGQVRLATVNDYVPDGFTTPRTLPDGSSRSVPRFALNPAFEFTGGELVTNGDREVEFIGASVNFIKRLSNRWMARGYFSYGEGEMDIGPNFRLFDDPNDASASVSQDSDGDVLIVQSAGSGFFENVFIQSTWQFNVNGLYQFAPDRPYGFNVAANVFGREGYPIPYDTSETLSDGRTRELQLVGKVDEFRLDDIFVVDVRIEKELAATGNVGLTLSLDVFNIFNENTELQRNRELEQGTRNFLFETLSPRIFRIGARLNWR